MKRRICLLVCITIFTFFLSSCGAGGIGSNGNISGDVLRGTEGLGNLEDYYSLSDDEAIELIKTNYESLYRDYYESLTGVLEEEQKLLDMIKDHYGDSPLLNEMDDRDMAYFTAQIQAIEETYDTLKNSSIAEPEPQDFSISLYADSTGNQTEAEEFRSTVSLPATFAGNPALGDSSYYFHVVDATTEDYYLHLQSGCDPFEVYDSYYGGFVGASDGYIYNLITKCEADAVFSLDPIGSKGLEVAN